MLEVRVAERTAELLHAKERVEAVLRSTSDAMIVANANSTIEEVNPAFTTLFGYVRYQDRPESLFSLVDSDSVDILRTTLDELASGSKAKRVELICKRQDGTFFDADAAFAQVQDGQLTTLMCSIRDVTLYKQAQDSLRVALATERELGDLKVRFVSMVSHEFRTPLASIRLSSDLMKSYADRMTSDQKTMHLDRIQTQVKSLTDMLEDILFMSRAESVGVQINLTAMDFAAFCRSAVDEMQLTATAHRIEFISTVPELTTKVDVKLMRQVVMNLLSNAVKYSPNGSVVHVDLNRDDSSVLLRVKDEGIGIPEEDQKHLFELFHRAQNVGTTPGTGLGLVIVKRAIEAHGGTVNIESLVGAGTTFTAAFPIT